MLKTLFKSKLLWITLTIFMILSTCCFASDDVAPISQEGENPEVSTTNDVVESSYQLLSSDVYRADTDLVVTEMIDGNAFLFGDTVTISGQINGNLFVCANTLNISESCYIYGSIFACARTITMEGKVYDIYAVAENISLKDNSIIARDARIAAESVFMAGIVNRDAYITTNTLLFPDDVETPIIGGNLNYTSTSEFTIPEGIVTGDINFTLESENEEIEIGSLIVSYVNKVLSSLLYSLVVLLLIIWLAPKFVEKSANLMKSKTPLSLGTGLLVSLVIIAGSISLIFLTGGLGFTISLAAIAIFVLALTISETVFSLATAKLLAKKIGHEKTLQVVLYALLTVLVINLIKLIPYIGGIFGFIICMIGLGIIFLNLVLKKSNPTDSEKVEEKTE